jgi:uncharacterized protein (TIGR02118 family)
MNTLLALYAAPDDPEVFLARYHEGHAPLVRQLPGLVSLTVTRIDRVYAGQGAPFLIAAMSFTDAEALKAAMKSPQMAAVGADVAQFADGLVTIVGGQVLEG